MSVFRINKKTGVAIEPELRKLVPELKNLDEKELRYLILVYDTIDSPMRRLGLQDRKKMATALKKNLPVRKILLQSKI
jgi:hypothetical protein